MGISIDNSRTESLSKYPIPTKSKQVKTFLGMAGFYRHFIKNFAHLAEPLNNLTRKNVKFIWSDECDKSFKQFIKLSTEKPILSFPNFNETFYLSTDALKTGVGVVLAQKDHVGREHPIHYASRTLNQAERNYSTIERKLSPKIYAVDKLRYYLN